MQDTTSRRRQLLVLIRRLRRSRIRSALERLAVRFALTEPQRLFALTIVIGAACGLAAVGFHLSIRAAERQLIDRAMSAGGDAWIGWTLLVPTLGGLLCGALLTFVVPGARGSGIPQVKAAYALPDRRVPLRDAAGKFILATFQIGSGASLGREGPTVQICAGLASSLGRLVRISPKNIRRLLPVGAAAGIAAAFNAPVAAVTFTVEELLGALDQTVLSGVVVAAAIAAVIERSILGTHPVLAVERTYGLTHASSLALYVVLGLAAAAVSIAFTDSLLALRGRMKTLRRLPGWAHPAIGGFVTGVLAIVAVGALGTGGVTGGGYRMLGQALSAQLGLRVLLTLGGLKIAATVASYGSGGAGGIFAPSLFIGGMLGGAVGHLDRLLLGHGSDVVGAFALVGMGSVFAGIIRAPITSVLIIFEMTGSYELILPLMLSNMIAYALARRFRPATIYDALLAQDGIHLPHRRSLADIRIAEAMSAPVEVIPERAPFREIMDRLRDTTHSAFPVVDEGGRLRGLLTLESLRPHLGDETLAAVVVAADICRATPPTALASESLEDALDRMTTADVDHLPVVADDDPLLVIGILTRRDILATAGRAAARERPTVPPPA